VALSVAAQAGAFLFFDFIPRDIGRASADFILSLAWLTGFIFLFFHGVQVMALDEERKVIYSLLLNLLLSGLGFGALTLIRQMVAPVYFSQLSIFAYLLSWLGLFSLQLLLLAVILLFSGLVRGSFPVLLIALAYYAICSGLPVVRESVAQQAAGDQGASGLHSLLVWLTALFPDFARLDFKNSITAVATLPEAPLLLIHFGLTGAYISLVLWLACLVYQRRDLQ